MAPSFSWPTSSLQLLMASSSLYASRKPCMAMQASHGSHRICLQAVTTGVTLCCGSSPPTENQRSSSHASASIHSR